MEPGGAYAALVRIVVNQSAWFITHVLNIDFNLNGNTFLFANNNFVTVNSSCSEIGRAHV